MRRLIIALLMISLPVSVFAGVPGFMKARMGVMIGQVTVDGRPLRGAIVSFFAKEKGPPPTIRGARRIPEALTRTDADGNFKIKLLPGAYYIGSMIRAKKDGPGPPRPGEKYFFALTADNTCKSFNLPSKKLVNIGIVPVGWPESIKVKDVFTVNGRLLDEAGRPFSGAVVMAKKSPEIMRPSFISDPTGVDGRFSIMLPANTPYYLLARRTIRGARPVPGSSIGTYGVIAQAGVASPDKMGAGQPPPGVLDTADDPGAPMAVTGKDGEIVNDIEITMFKVPDPVAIKAGMRGEDDSPEPGRGTQINNIFFASNSAVLTADSFAELDKWLAFIKARPGIKILLTGYTDNIGQSAYNRSLSENRARAVAAYFVQHGIDPHNISVSGKGAELPIADNASPAGRCRNRRVEIKFSVRGL